MCFVLVIVCHNHAHLRRLSVHFKMQKTPSYDWKLGAWLATHSKTSTSLFRKIYSKTKQKQTENDVLYAFYLLFAVVFHFGKKGVLLGPKTFQAHSQHINHIKLKLYAKHRHIDKHFTRITMKLLNGIDI